MKPEPSAADFLVVTDVFRISGRGVVAAVSLAAARGWAITTGDVATFERPDGLTFRTGIRGIAVPRTTPPNTSLALLLGPDVTGTDMIPAGTRLLRVEGRLDGAT